MSTTFIDAIKPNDVLCGRGGLSNQHIGNKMFRRIVFENKDLYNECINPRKKQLLVTSIIQAIQKHGGRFIKKQKEDNRWVEITTREATVKTSQALRDACDRFSNGDKITSFAKSKLVMKVLKQKEEERKEAEKTINSIPEQDSVEMPPPPPKPVAVSPAQSTPIPTVAETSKDNCKKSGRKGLHVRKVSDASSQAALLGEENFADLLEEPIGTVDNHGLAEFLGDVFNDDEDGEEGIEASTEWARPQATQEPQARHHQQQQQQPMIIPDDDTTESGSDHGYQFEHEFDRDYGYGYDYDYDYEYFAPLEADKDFGFQATFEFESMCHGLAVSLCS